MKYVGRKIANADDVISILRIYTDPTSAFETKYMPEELTEEEEIYVKGQNLT